MLIVIVDLYLIIFDLYMFIFNTVSSFVSIIKSLEKQNTYVIKWRDVKNSF